MYLLWAIKNVRATLSTSLVNQGLIMEGNITVLGAI